MPFGQGQGQGHGQGQERRKAITCTFLPPVPPRRGAWGARQVYKSFSSYFSSYKCTCKKRSKKRKTCTPTYLYVNVRREVRALVNYSVSQPFNQLKKNAMVISPTKVSRDFSKGVVFLKV